MVYSFYYVSKCVPSIVFFSRSRTMPSAMTTVAATEPITSTMSRTVLAVRNVNKIVLVFILLTENDPDKRT
jgi:hypothetical protein